MARFRIALIATLTTGLAWFPHKLAVAVEGSDLLRASVIEKIARFIEWPESKPSQINLCVFEGTPLLPALEHYYDNGYTDNIPVKLVKASSFKSFSECQIIYLGAPENNKLDNILRAIDQQAIMLITENEDDVSKGVHVDFFVADNRLHLEINRSALARNNLKASYHLLGAARVVE